MSKSLYSSSKAFIRIKDIFQGFGISDWKTEWLNFFSSIEVLGFNNARSALYCLLKSTKSNNKNEVIISAYTCPSVSEIVEASGYIPIYCDIDFDLGVMSIDELKKLVNNNTHSIISGNTFGMVDQVIEIKQIIQNKDIYFFEDITWCLGGVNSEKPLGSFGDAAFFSLGAGKNLTVGQGGILLINSKKIKILLDKKKLPDCVSQLNPILFLKIIFYNLITNKYIYKLLNYVELTPADNVPAVKKSEFLSYQLMDIYRKKISSNAFNGYLKMLSKRIDLFNQLISTKDLERIKFPELSNSIFSYSSRKPLILNSYSNRKDLISLMHKNGFEVTRGFYQVKKNLIASKHINAIKYCDRLVTLPFHYDMNEKDLNKMISLL